LSEGGLGSSRTSDGEELPGHVPRHSTRRPDARNHEAHRPTHSTSHASTAIFSGLQAGLPTRLELLSQQVPQQNSSYNSLWAVFGKEKNPPTESTARPFSVSVQDKRDTEMPGTLNMVMKRERLVAGVMNSSEMCPDGF
jgi:hypothetical protein